MRRQQVMEARTRLGPIEGDILNIWRDLKRGQSLAEFVPPYAVSCDQKHNHLSEASSSLEYSILGPETK